MGDLKSHIKHWESRFVSAFAHELMGQDLIDRRDNYIEFCCGMGNSGRLIYFSCSPQCTLFSSLHTAIEITLPGLLIETLHVGSVDEM